MALTDKTIFTDKTDSPFDTFDNVSNPFYGNDVASIADSYLDPFQTGLAFIYWIKLPTWFEKDEDLKHFKTSTQKSFRGFQGMSDVTLNTTTVTSGFNGNEANYATNVTRGNTDFTLAFREYDQTPIRSLFRKWIYYIRDPNTGICLYPTTFNVDYGCRNHSGQLLYVIMRPDVLNTGAAAIEYAEVLYNVIPANDPKGTLFNYSIGQSDNISEISIDMKGVPDDSPAVKEYARTVVTDYLLNTDTTNPNGNIFLTSLMHAGDKGTELLTHGILKDIYNTSK
jgi:hypothetical protein